MATEKTAGKSEAKTSKEMSDAIQRFLEDGGEIEKIPYNSSKEDDDKKVIGNLNPKVPQLMTLPEAADMFGEKSKRKKKKKEVDLSGIDQSLIPASLQGLFDEKDKECHEADTN